MAAELNDLITSDPEILGGRPVFLGTRVAVEVLFEDLADGNTADEILSKYEIPSGPSPRRCAYLRQPTTALP